MHSTIIQSRTLPQRVPFPQSCTLNKTVLQSYSTTMQSCNDAALPTNGSDGDDYYYGDDGDDGDDTIDSDDGDDGDDECRE